MKKYLHLDHAGFAVLRNRVLDRQSTDGDDLATILALNDIGVSVPPYVTEVEVVVQSEKPAFLQLDDE